MDIGETGKTFIRIGPQGSEHGDKWDDGCFDGVREILIWHGDKINAIQFVYDRNGMLVLSHKHGGNGTNFDHIQLDYPSEYLILINGSFGKEFYQSPASIESLKFSSNRRSFGPFGCSEPGKKPASKYDFGEAANHFHFKVMDNKLCGFFGRSNADYLRAIGIHFRAL